jgi:DNA-binding GntR family transcriptional regulator
VQKNDPAVLARLKEVHNAIVAAVTNGAELAYHRLNREFHAVLTRSCGNRRLINMKEPGDLRSGTLPEAVGKAFA